MNTTGHSATIHNSIIVNLKNIVGGSPEQRDICEDQCG